MPTPPIDIEQAAKWAAGGTLSATMLGMVARFLMKTFRTDRLEATLSTADTNTFTRLQSEIQRLEQIIIGMQKRTDELEARLDKLRDIELDDVSDIATLTVLINQMPCGKCQDPSIIFRDAREVLGRMNTRKRETQVLIRGIVPPPQADEIKEIKQ